MSTLSDRITRTDGTRTGDAGAVDPGLGLAVRGLPEVNRGVLGDTADLPGALVGALAAMAVSTGSVRLWRHVRDAAGGTGRAVVMPLDDVADALRSLPGSVRRWRAMLVAGQFLALGEADGALTWTALPGS